MDFRRVKQLFIAEGSVKELKVGNIVVWTKALPDDYIEDGIYLTTTSLGTWYTGINGSVTLTAESELSPLTYHAEGLPEGLSLDSTTGEISGTVSSAGSSEVTVWAEAYPYRSEKVTMIFLPIPSAYNVKYKVVIAGTTELTRGSEPSPIVVGGNDKDLYLKSNIGFTDYLAFNRSYKEITGEDIKLTAGFTAPEIQNLPDHYRYYIDDTANMVLTTDDGTTYNYGTDFIIRMDVSKSSGFDGDGNIKGNQTLTLSWAHNSNDDDDVNGFVRGYYNLSHGKSYAASIDASTTSTWKSPASGTNYSLSFQKEFSGSSLSVLPSSAFSEENVGKIEITSTDGSTRYRYGKDYTIEDGELVWLIEDDDGTV